ncbi:heme exporter protein CcmD [Stappia sp.]|uniref:heme exporter protein CcmD n=1 Tax=Stappia sp. TaxID=1870903 RepID=UPI0032D97516
MIEFMIEFLDLGPHWGFIVACYIVTIGVIGALFVWIRADQTSLRSRLATLEAQGIRRRSTQGATSGGAHEGARQGAHRGAATATAKDPDA